MDLSLRSVPTSAAAAACVMGSVSVVKPIPRHPCPAIWYRTMWPAPPRHCDFQPHTIAMSSWSPQVTRNSLDDSTKRGFCSYKPSGCQGIGIGLEDTVAIGLKSEGANLIKTKKRTEACAFESRSPSFGPGSPNAEAVSSSSRPRLFLDITSASNYSHGHGLGPCINLSQSPSYLLDIATCDGPVHFERVSNPNFALTVQHCCTSDNANDTKTDATASGLRQGQDADDGEPVSRPKTYTCIYCHQSFKSLFCYQKHKKRHINPVSVDLTGGSAINPNSENNQGATGRTNSGRTQATAAKYLNVQFFPCKICGCKFPSYYFVHKHIKLCHS